MSRRQREFCDWQLYIRYSGSSQCERYCSGVYQVDDTEWQQHRHRDTVLMSSRDIARSGPSRVYRRDDRLHQRKHFVPQTSSTRRELTGNRILIAEQQRNDITIQSAFTYLRILLFPPCCCIRYQFGSVRKSRSNRIQTVISQEVETIVGCSRSTQRSRLVDMRSHLTIGGFL